MGNIGSQNYKSVKCTSHLPVWSGLSFSSISPWPPWTRTSFEFHLGALLRNQRVVEHFTVPKKESGESLPKMINSLSVLQHLSKDSHTYTDTHKEECLLFQNEESHESFLYYFLEIKFGTGNILIKYTLY